MKCPKCQSEDTKKVYLSDPKWKAGHQRCQKCLHQDDWGAFCTPPIVIETSVILEKPEISYCEKCNKIVPEDQVKFYSPNSFHKGYYLHQFESYQNIAPPSDGMNACLAMVNTYCGNIREATTEEYFVHITCSPKE
jgi:hypothetical protein